MREIYLSKIEPDQNQFRWYRLALPAGSRELLQQWGRIADYITEKWDMFPSQQAAKEAFDKLQAEKEREGYRATDSRVLPKNYLLYQRSDPGPGVVLEPPSGQLSLFDEG